MLVFGYIKKLIISICFSPTPWCCSFFLFALFAARYEASTYLGGIWWWWGKWEGRHMVCMLGTLKWELEETAAAGSLPKIFEGFLCWGRDFFFSPNVKWSPQKTHQVLKKTTKQLGGCKDFLNFTPYLGKWSNFTFAYFSDRLVQKNQLEIRIATWCWSCLSQPWIFFPTGCSTKVKKVETLWVQDWLKRNGGASGNSTREEQNPVWSQRGGFGDLMENASYLL